MTTPLVGCIGVVRHRVGTKSDLAQSQQDQRVELPARAGVVAAIAPGSSEAEIRFCGSVMRGQGSKRPATLLKRIPVSPPSQASLGLNTKHRNASHPISLRSAARCTCTGALRLLACNTLKGAAFPASLWLPPVPPCLRKGS